MRNRSGIWWWLFLVLLGVVSYAGFWYFVCTLPRNSPEAAAFGWGTMFTLGAVYSVHKLGKETFDS